MKKKLCLLIVVNSSLLFASAQNKINRDTIDPKLTEVWSPVPPIVTPGKPVMMPLRMLLSYLTGKISINGGRPGNRINQLAGR